MLLPRRGSASSAGGMVPAALKGNTVAPRCVQFFLISFSLCKISGRCLMPSYILTHVVDVCRTAKSLRPRILSSACLTAVAVPLCSLFLPLPRQICCYQSRAADIFLIIPSLQSIFCKQLVNAFWDLESLF